MSIDHGAVELDGEIYAYDSRELGPNGNPPLVTQVGSGQPAMADVPVMLLEAIADDWMRQQVKRDGLDETQRGERG